jgi:hypothetical protein
MVLPHRIRMAVILWAAVCLPMGAKAQDIQYGQDPNAEKKMTLLLKDWAPAPMVHLPRHEISRAKFYVIDMHNHVNDATGVHAEQVPPEDVVKAMDAANVKKIVILTGMWGDKLQGVLDKMVKPYPDRFVVFAQMDWSKIDDPQFSELMVAQLDDAVKRGARGLKILKDWGLGVRDKSGKLVPIDDPRMDPVWEECGKLGKKRAIRRVDAQPELEFLRGELSGEIDGARTTKPRDREASAYDLHSAARGQLAGESGRRFRVAAEVSEHVRGIRSERGRAGQAATTRVQVFLGVSGPDYVRDGRGPAAGDVSELFSLA